MFDIIKLPYDYDALEPYIDSETVNIHYNKHHKKYLDNLNKLVFKDILLEDIPKRIDEFPLEKRGAILYNAGGVLNHNLYFQGLFDVKSYPSGKLAAKISEVFGSFDSFKDIFISKARLLVGSGYTFLVMDKVGNLSIINLPNQETPFSYDLIPLFTVDLWEHAYYLKYKNDKDSYLKNIWNKVNFDYASSLYDSLV